MCSSADAAALADPLVPFETTAIDAPPSLDLSPWRVLIVDDDDDVHITTELAMRDVVVEGHALLFLHASSAADAVALVAADPDIAVVLLDVVMETPDAGLRLVQQIRQELGRDALRIILRTGQPGYAPEIETLRAFDINDYRTKSELNRTRLFASLTVAIRSYRQLRDLVDQRDELERLHAAVHESLAAERAEGERRLAAEAALRLVNESVEQCVEQRTRELSTAVTELDAFNRMVSHDLRGPLHGLARLSGLVRSEMEHADPAEVRRWLSMIEQQTRRLADLVDDLLSLSRVSKGGLQLGPVDLGVVARDALQTLALTHDRTRLATVSVAPMPELVGDSGLLRQVFVNLLSNALKFTRESTAPAIEIRAERRDGDWLVTVRDNGVGFEVAKADDLFKPFSRLHGARFEGAGIGLTIVQRIVERHGGHIWASGRPGAGATFQFTLPMPP